MEIGRLHTLHTSRADMGGLISTGTLKASQERCQSGRMGRPAKALSVLKRTVGSNPTLSAMRILRTATVAFLVAGAALVSAPAPVGAKVATNCAKSYTVVKNDSWSRIATKVKVSMNSLLIVNKAKTSTMLLIGDVICLPKDAVTKSDTQKSNGLQLAAPAVRYSRSESADIIRDVFPSRLEERALAIAKRESKLNAASYSWCCVGLFQIYWSANKAWLVRMGITSPEQLLDAHVNAKAAYEMYKRNSGWKPWE